MGLDPGLGLQAEWRLGSGLEPAMPDGRTSRHTESIIIAAHPIEGRLHLFESLLDTPSIGHEHLLALPGVHR